MINNLSRQVKRANDRKIKKNVQAISKLTPDQYRLIDKITDKKANEQVNNIANIINECYFKAMRSNGISEARAKKILAATEDNIKLKGNEN